MTLPINNAQIVHTTAEWATLGSYVLAVDVIGIEVMSNGYNRYKRGDGATAWSSLAYLRQEYIIPIDDTPTDGSSNPVSSNGVYDALAGKAALTHSHSADDITSETLPIGRGGTGVTTAAAMLRLMGNTGLGRHFSTWANYGRCVDTNYNFNYYANLVMTALSPTNVVLKMTGKVGSNYNSTSYYQYGISISALTSQITTWLATLGYTVSSVSYLPKSQWLAWSYGTGALLTNAMEYGTCFEVDTSNGVLRPARVYTTGGAVGGWGIGTWTNNTAYFEATIFADVTLS